MTLVEKFTTMDEEENEDHSAIFYMHEHDMRDLVLALELATQNPKTAFMKKEPRFLYLRKQLQNALK